MTIWKFGVHIFGGANPSHYNFIRHYRISIGSTNRAPFRPGDLVAITEGFSLLAITEIQSEPIPFPYPLTPDWQKQFGHLTSSQLNLLVYAPAKWCELDQPVNLPYQSGACHVVNPQYINLIEGIWNAGPYLKLGS